MLRSLKLFASEFKLTILANLIAAIIISLFALIPIFLTDDINTTRKSFRLLSAGLSQVLIYSIINKIRAVVKDKSTVDRNRVMFLTNKKEIVIASKVLIDLFGFSLPIILFIALGFPILTSKHAIFSNQMISKIIVFMFAMIIIYLVSTLGIRLITSLELKPLKTWIIIGVWTTLTLIVAIASGIAFGILSNSYPSIQSFLKDHEIILSLMPIINFITPFLVLYDFMSLWTVVPMIFESLFLIIISWKKVSSILKTYLTT